ncbi:hypothetical protein BSKO_07669 [Bryopsis sp. KO-2023]|nr:hypothetical protein BSKO_07669 [Bryopsis sp. KO-2023]
MENLSVGSIALLVVLSLAVLREVAAVPTTVKVCVPYTVGTGFTRDCSAALSKANNDDVEFVCVEGGSAEKCISMLDLRKADVTTLDGGDIFHASENFGLTPLVVEDLDDGAPAGLQYAVAVVKKEFCKNSSVSLADLKGTRSCHAGYKKMAGWYIPVGALAVDTTDFSLPEKTISTIEDDAEMVVNFFSKTCAPRTLGNGPQNGAGGVGENWEELCTACKGDCSAKDLYYDHKGAFRCLTEDSGDVAFVKHTTVLEYASDGSADELQRAWSENPKSDFRLLCRDGGCMDVEDFKTCNLALAPGHALVGTSAMTKGDFEEDLGAAIQKALLNAGDGFVENTTELVVGRGFLWSAGASSLKAAPSLFPNPAAITTLSSFSNIVSDQQVSKVTAVKVCIPYPLDESAGRAAGFLRDCTAAVGQANTALLEFECIAGGSAEGCKDLLKSGEAHVTTLEGGDVFTGDESGLIPTITEDLGDGAPPGTYYAVAVVNKEFCEGKKPTLADLQGTRSCHTGFRKIGGWSLPLGALLDNVSEFRDGDKDLDDIEDDAELVANFFSETCAPRTSGNGPQNGAGGVGEKWDKLCTACKGDCSSKDLYYDYKGAFRCLAEDSGDVAFVKHTTVLEYASDGSVDETLRAWSEKPKSDFQLLCRDGGCMDVEDFESCNLGLAPGHAMVLAPGLDDIPVGDGTLSEAINAAILNAGPNFLIETRGFKNSFMWSPGTQTLQATEGDFLSEEASSALTALSKIVSNEDVPELTTVKVCVPYPLNESPARAAGFLRDCTAAIGTANTAKLEFECVAGGSPDACSYLLETGEAHVTTMEGGDLFSLEDQSVKLVPTITEDLGDGAPPGTYYAVAVVNKEFCEDGKPTLADLKGTRSCLTGYRKMGGWFLPLGALMEDVPEFGKGVTEFDDVHDDAELVADFFSETCAPRTLANGPRLGVNDVGENWDELCTGCKGDCSSNDIYYDYKGAFRCLTEDSGDVAFVKHTTVLEYASDGSADELQRAWSEKPMSDFQLLCRDGGCMDVEDFKSCNLGLAPGHAMVLAPELDETLSEDINAAILDAGPKFLEETAGFKNSFMWSKGTKSLEPIEGDFLTDDASAALTSAAKIIAAEDALDSATVKVCVPYPLDESPARAAGFLRDCTAAIGTANTARLEFECVAGGSAGECVDMLNSGKAHMTTLEGGDLFTVGDQSLKLVPTITEDLGDGAPPGTYYAVAVVNKEFCEDGKPTLADLKGTRSCHTGFRKMGGWFLPLGALMEEVSDFEDGDKTFDDIEDDAELVANFFSETCAPRTHGNGPQNGVGGVGEKWDDMCTGCKGDCSSNDIYYDYKGAFRCLTEDSGDVAFVKHTTVLEYASDGSADELQRAWSEKPMSDFQLLCRNGGCMDVEDFKSCNLGLAPGHAMVLAPDLDDVLIGEDTLSEAINEAILGAGPEFLEKTRAFKSSFLWSQGTKSLEPIEGDFLTDDGAAALKALSDLIVEEDVRKVKTVKVCVPYYLNESPARAAGFLRDCTAAIGTANTADLEFECVAGGSSAECVDLLKSGEAHVTTLEGGDVFVQDQFADLIPVIMEDLGDGAPAGTYYSVAVVNKEFCEDGEPTLADLKGTRSCHTGYRRMGGWLLPFSALMEEVSDFRNAERIVDDVHDDAELMANFFTETCAPRTLSNGPKINAKGFGENWDELCTGCKGDCSTNDLYYDYKGAFRCLTEDSGDVAFVKHTTVLEYASDGSADELQRAWSEKPMSDFQLLCRDGGCMDVEDFESCNLGLAPGHAMYLAPGLDFETVGESNLKIAITDAILEAGPEFLEKTRGFKNSFVWSQGTKSLEPIQDDFLTDEAEDALLALSGVDEGIAPKLEKTRVKVCVPYPLDESPLRAAGFLRDCTAAVGIANTDGLEFECVPGGSAEGCVDLLKSGVAHATTLEGGDVFTGDLSSGLIPTVLEDHNDGAPLGTYYSVAVVNKEFCEDGEPTLADLKGTRSCHTGFRKMGGWFLPLGALLDDVSEFRTGERTLDDIEDDAELVAGFFSETCAPRTSGRGPKIGDNDVGEKWDKLCTGCKGDCSTNDIYYDYDGAFRCLTEDSGDVAFVRHTTVLDYASDGAADEILRAWSGKPKSDFKLLCREGGCKDVEEYGTCNLGLAPGHAMIVSPELQDVKFEDRTLSEAIKEAILDAGPKFLEKTRGLKNNFMWTKGTKSLEPVTGDFLTAEARASLTAVQSVFLDVPKTASVQQGLTLPAVFCAKNDREMKFCRDVVRLLKKVSPEFGWGCHEEKSSEACLRAISVNAAQWKTVDGSDLYLGFTKYGLSAVIGENSGWELSTSYYSVAVVKKEFCTSDDISLADVKGARSCHTGYRKSAGWDAVMASLISTRLMPVVDNEADVENDAESAASFFSSVCAPRVSDNGPMNSRDGEGQIWKPLCEGCKGDCSNDDLYYDYSGALRCLMDDGGDVMFTKHSAILGNGMDSSDFRLLCADKRGCQPVSEFDSCNLARFPAPSVVVKYGSYMTRGSQFQNALVAASKMDEFKDMVFSRENNPYNYMFSNDAVGLVRIDSDTTTYLGESDKVYRTLESVRYQPDLWKDDSGEGQIDIQSVEQDQNVPLASGATSTVYRWVPLLVLISFSLQVLLSV